LQWPEKQSTPKKPEQELPGRVAGDFSKQKQDRISVGGKARGILQDSVKCVLHVRSVVKLDIFVYSALFRFNNSLVLKNAT